ncbi:Exodeoxyribonuclease V alpha chain [uncultured Roseburia sp.]|uniref:ATP-dependent RecD2 DNA helicase n=1 Tax=Brotonthovivens ammoniilytica TaxID=2981725 RepID=A0ABT2TKG0_9FIRM|nr:ATP-dependent RecD-like DNA helicase [Brotonthovivens ammoniilytica]MCU6762693.1 ATP-dependent RecD-like DNA helicase [Brotonthovivens ammoniilytica]SCI85014.1 Exodeoxyribonuclease V alpha chain [uncultured Roseburia sp.]
METITGYVEHIVYRNEDNGYTVLNLISDGEEIPCTGIFHVISEGETIEAKGEFQSHPTYGEQFKVTEFQTKAPEDVVSIERYLGSGAIKGVGAALASRIVRRFKEDTFRIIEQEPERLVEIKGISERKAREIAEQTEEKRELRQAMIFLQKYGISLTLAVKIYQTYGLDVYRIIQENPYKLADDMSGVGFKIADEIARRVGIHTDSDFRIRSGILYVLQQAAGEGHTCLPQGILTKRTSDILEVAPEFIEKHYMDMSIERKLMLKEMRDDVFIYAASYYYMEVNTATMLKALNVTYDVADAPIEQRVHKIEKSTNMQLDDMQMSAVKEAVRNGLLVITGGPGTGKTTTINTIIRYFESEGMDIFLAAPTGRAAKRMSETTGFEARTIHRMLELNGGMEGSAGFEKNEKNPLETDVVIIDEMSMVDITLMHSLLKAVMYGTRLILVGDANQLPSVGPGSVLKDIIDSKACSVVRLTRIFRQASKSDIVVNAHKINRGEEVVLDNKSRDFFFLKRYDADVIISVCIQLIKQKLPKYVDAQPFDIQILTPMRKGLLGVERLNGILQQYLNPKAPDKAEREHGQMIFREGDKIMQTKNNYQIEWEIRSKYGIPVDKGMGVFNGDMGIVREINGFSETMTVEFEEGRMVDYPFKQLDELDLAYAITVHKSQGSEYPAVVIPLLGGPRMLMNRNLLYTAVTRAKKCVTLVGDDTAFQEMAFNVSEQKRYSGLKEQLQSQI